MVRLKVGLGGAMQRSDKGFLGILLGNPDHATDGRERMMTQPTGRRAIAIPFK
jgi:hypothetical protein